MYDTELQMLPQKTTDCNTNNHNKLQTKVRIHATHTK